MNNTIYHHLPKARTLSSGKNNTINDYDHLPLHFAPFLMIYLWTTEVHKYLHLIVLFSTYLELHPQYNNKNTWKKMIRDPTQKTMCVGKAKRLTAVQRLKETTAQLHFYFSTNTQTWTHTLLYTCLYFYLSSWSEKW